MSAPEGGELGRLLDEQLAYYRALAPDYLHQGLDLPGGDEVIQALDAFRPTGRVLELACGPGVWTGHLLRHASEVTAVDASPEMLRILLVRRWLTAWTSGPGVLRRRRLPDPGRTPGRPVVLHHPPAAP